MVVGVWRGGKGRERREGNEGRLRYITRQGNTDGCNQTYHMGHWTSSANLSMNACCPAGSRSASPSGGRGEGGAGAAGAALIMALLLPPAAFSMWPCLVVVSN